MSAWVYCPKDKQIVNREEGLFYDFYNGGDSIDAATSIIIDILDEGLQPKSSKVLTNLYLRIKWEIDNK